MIQHGDTIFLQDAVTHVSRPIISLHAIWHNGIRLNETTEFGVIVTGAVPEQVNGTVSILTREGVAGHLVIAGILRIGGRRFRVSADFSPRLIPDLRDLIPIFVCGQGG
jgi:hypothetical protein